MSKRYFCRRVKAQWAFIRVKIRAQAVKHYEGKVEYIKTNLETLQEAIQKKQDNLNLLVNVIQSKLQAETSK